MPMIDTHQLKPASDAVQTAFNDWWDAGQHIARLRQCDPVDTDAVLRAEREAYLSGHKYDVLARELAQKVRVLISKAELAAAQG